MAQKVGRTRRLEKHSGANSTISQLVFPSSAIIGEHFGANRASEAARKAQFWQI